MRAPKPSLVLLGPLAAALFTTGCGPAGKPGRHRAADPSAAGKLFPASETSLLAAPVLEALPAQTPAVVVFPSLEKARSIFGQTGVRSQRAHVAGEGLTKLFADKLGHDLFSMGDMRSLGIDTTKPMALALLDGHAAAVAVPLRSPKRFYRGWGLREDNFYRINRGHAVIAFALGDDLDPSADAVVGLAQVAERESLAVRADLRGAAEKLRYGPDIAIFVQTDPVRRAAIENFRREVAAVDIEELRDLADLARQDGDRDTIDEAEYALARGEARLAHTRAWWQLFEQFVTPTESLAIGVGLEPDTVKVKSIISLKRSAGGWKQVIPLPRDSQRARQAPGREVSFATRMPPELISRLLRLYLDNNHYRDVAKILAGVGGARALTGALEVTTTTSGERSMRPTRVNEIRLGVREPGRVGKRVSTLKGVFGKSWQLTVADGQLLLTSKNQRGSRARLSPGTGKTTGHQAGKKVGKRAKKLAGTLARIPAPVAVFTVDATTLLALAAPPRNELLGLIEDATVNRALLSGSGSRNQLLMHTKLSKKRRKLQRELERRTDTLRDRISRQLGIAFGVVSRTRSTVTVHAVHTIERGDVVQLAADGLELWFENSAYSTVGEKLAAVDRRIAELERAMGMSRINDLVSSNGKSAKGLGGISGGVPGGVPGGVVGGVLGGVPGGGIAIGSGRAGTGRWSGLGRAGSQLRVTASITRADPSIDRIAVGEALLHAVPKLQQCYLEHRKRKSEAEGYMVARLHFAGRGFIRVSTASAASARDMSDAKLTGCIDKALQNLPGVTGQSGTVSATLWFGSR